MTRLIRRTGFLAAVMAVVVILALSSACELIEWWIALLVSHDAAHADLGTQGDLFDSQQDTTKALADAVFGIAAAARRSACGRERCAERAAIPELPPVRACSLSA